MYPPIAAIVAHATGGEQRHPLVMCEFSHAMGNSNGTLAEYWDAIEATPGLQGGFIWEWRDHGLEQRLPDGTVRHAYGGDFGDTPNDGVFVIDGITFPDRAPKPAMFEHVFLASPVRARSDDAAIAAAREGRVTLENRGEFRDTVWLRAAWEASVDGEVVASGDLPLPAIEPGDTGEVSIPGWILPDGAGGERWLTLRFLTADATEWAAAGYEIGWAQVPLDDAAAGGTAPHEGWTGDVAVDDEGGLLHPAFAAPPALSLWRAPTDNDRIGGMADRWAGWGLAAITRRLEGIDRAGDAVTVRATWTTATGLEIPHTQRLSRSPTAPPASRSRWRSRPRSRTSPGSARCSSWPRATRRSSGSGAGRTRRTPIASGAAASGAGGRRSPSSSSATSARRRTAATPTRAGSG